VAVNGGPERSGESATEKIPPREIKLAYLSANGWWFSAYFTG